MVLRVEMLKSQTYGQIPFPTDTFTKNQTMQLCEKVAKFSNIKKYPHQIVWKALGVVLFYQKPLPPTVYLSARITGILQQS